MTKNNLIDKINAAKVIIFDIDNTLYQDKVEYQQGHGTVRERYDFFERNLFELLFEGKNEFEAEEEAIRRYKETEKKDIFEYDLKDGTLPAYNELKKQYASAGTLLSETFNARKTLLHGTFCNIDFDNILVKNEILQTIIKKLESENKKLGVFTNNTYKASKQILSSIGLNPESFYMPIDGNIPFFTRENTLNPKPSTDTYESFSKIYGVESGEILYIGDSYKKDVIPSALAGINVIYVNTKSSENNFKEKYDKENNIGYVEINAIEKLEQIFYNNMED